MNRRQAARARRYAHAIVAWRAVPLRGVLLTIPPRYRGDGDWVLVHLLRPRARIGLRAQRDTLGRAS